MTATKPERRVVIVTDDTTRADIAETIGLFNAEAKAMSRRGHVGIAHEDYKRQHARINDLLTDWQRAPA